MRPIVASQDDSSLEYGDCVHAGNVTPLCPTVRRMRTLAVVAITAAIVAALCALYWIAGELHYQSCLRAPQPARASRPAPIWGGDSSDPWGVNQPVTRREPRASRLPR